MTASDSPGGATPGTSASAGGQAPVQATAIGAGHGRDRDRDDGTGAGSAAVTGARAARAGPGRPAAGGSLPGQARPRGAWPGRVTAWRADPVAWRADPVAWLIAAGVFAAYAAISVFRYLRLAPASWDLGIFTEYVKQYAHLRAPVTDARAPGLNLLGDHFHPIVALIAPFFRLVPSPATLLIVQALLAALSVLPVSRAAANRLGRGPSRAITAAYGFSWGLQQLIYFDFHEIAFAVPLLACSLSALARGKVRAAVAWALPLVFVKEDQGFTVAAIGLIIALGYRHKLAGAALVAWGLAWSLLAIDVIIPSFNPAGVYPYWSKGGELSPGDSSISPGGLVHQLIAAPSVKLPTLALILLPTAFCALRSPLVLAAVPSLALRFVSTNTAFWGTGWHYNATVMPIVFIAAADGIARIKAARTRAGQGAAVTDAGSAVTDAGSVAGGGLAGAGAQAAPARAAPDRAGARAPRVGSVRRAGPLPGLRRRFAWAGDWLGAMLERHAPAMMLAVCAALAFQFPLSGLWQSQTYQLGPHVAAARAAMALVPDGATVQADIDMLAPLGARTDAFWIGNSPLWQGRAGNPATRYVVVDQSAGDLPPHAGSMLSYVELLNRGITYRLIYRADGVYVFVRSAA